MFVRHILIKPVPAGFLVVSFGKGPNNVPAKWMASHGRACRLVRLLPCHAHKEVLMGGGSSSCMIHAVSDLISRQPVVEEAY